MNIYHCEKKDCGPNCIFAVENCPNPPCLMFFSKKWASQHDAVCKDKILPCERYCGEHVARKNMNLHLLNDCCLRPVKCPFDCVGCKTGKFYITY